MKRSRSDKLDAGKFRLINEMLYTSESSSSWDLFHKDPSYFQIYHQGFSTQVSSWPINPLEIVEQEVRLLCKVDPLVLADLGCGQGQLELNLKDLKQLRVYSYDLVSTRDHVIECDISNLPTRNRKIDIAVFCLSLMGTNHVNMIKEAHRVLKKKGKLIIAEVSTRFTPQEFLSNMHLLGFKNLKSLHPNSFFSVFVFRKIRAYENSVSSLLTPCKYKKR